MSFVEPISFTVPGIPAAWARARTRGRIHFTPSKQRGAMAVVQTIAADAMADRPPLLGPLAMRITAVWPWPKSLSQKKRNLPGAQYRTARPDADNLGKLVSDALNGIAFGDDSQIVELLVHKKFGASAATHVHIEALA